MFDAANALIDDANKDEELREGFKSLDERRIPYSHLPCHMLDCYRKSSFNPATSSSPTAAAAVTNSATPVVNSTMASTKPTSIVSSRRSGTGSEP